MIKRLLVIALPIALLLPLSGSASARISANPNRLLRGTFGMVDFQVPGGCDGRPTKKLVVEIPEGASLVRPLAKPGWSIKTKIAKLKTPVKLRDREVTRGVVEITWTAAGKPLPSTLLDTFTISMRADARPGSVLYFPAQQHCVGKQIAWKVIPPSLDKWGQVERPAPFVRVGAAQSQGSGAAQPARPQSGGSTSGSGGGALAVFALLVGLAGATMAGLALRDNRRLRESLGKN